MAMIYTIEIHERPHHRWLVRLFAWPAGTTPTRPLSHTHHFGEWLSPDRLGDSVHSATDREELVRRAQSVIDAGLAHAQAKEDIYVE